MILPFQTLRTTLISLLFAPVLVAAADTSALLHGVAMHGQPRYAEDFTHFDYVNPAAPKGGELRMATVSSSGFDSMNPFIIKGVPASGISTYLYETLTVQADDEPFSQYGLVAERIEMPEDRSWVIFHINPKARFHDGHPITAEDVLYTFELLTTKGHPFYAAYYHDVIKQVALDSHTVKFSFRNTENRELPLIMGQLPVLPKHYWQDKEFDKTSLDIPLGSGPYRVKSVDPGRSIVWERVADYWAADLPVVKGQYNFDTVRFDYYRDGNVALEALKSGNYDFRLENTAKTWAALYEGPQFDSGRIIKEELAHQLPTGMQAFAMNIRRAQFKDARVRQALAYAFDFEWTNRQIFNSAYTRTDSFFSNSELAATQLPGAEELAILEPFRKLLPPEVFTTAYKPPATKGDGNTRSNIRAALKLLKDAGWEIRNKALTNLASGEVMKFEIMLASPDFQRVVLPYRKNLERLGIQVEIRLVDPQQYVNRLNEFDFDMIVSTFGQSNSPGNEQRDYWHSSKADLVGSRNIIGIKDPVIDALIEQVISAPDREQLVYRTRALDRVLQWHHYVIPQWHIRHFRVAYWDKFARPVIPPKFNLGLDTWWQKAN